MIDGFEGVFVHYAAVDDPGAAEQAMLTAYREAMNPELTALLHDSERIAPFANVDTAKQRPKRHGLSNYKDVRLRSPSLVPQPKCQKPKQSSSEGEPGTPASGGTITVSSQKVTDKDRAKTYLRIPARSKHAFPDLPTTIQVEIRGEIMEVAWQPNGTRSGTMGLGIEVMRSLRERDECIHIEVLHDRYRLSLR